jgi:hypothetical protein
MTDPDRGRGSTDNGLDADELDADQLDADELYEEMTEGRDETTSRESFERALIEQGRSEEGAEIGEHIE